MAWEIVEEEIEGKWDPKKVGASIEGNVFEKTEDDYGKTVITLDLGDDEKTGEMITCDLPTHKHIQGFVNNIDVGDYIRVTVIKIIEPKQEGFHAMNIYKVEKDPERKTEYEIE